MLTRKTNQAWLIPVFLLLPAWSGAQNQPVPSAPNEAGSDLPRVVKASVPFYPELARQTHIQGTVILRVSTDGKLVSDVKAESSHPILVAAAIESVKSWEFKPHPAMSFAITFRYTLFVPKCDSDCKCDRGEGGERESVVLHLPTDVELSAPTLLTCDPVAEIVRKKSIFSRLFHLH